MNGPITGPGCGDADARTMLPTCGPYGADSMMRFDYVFDCPALMRASASFPFRLSGFSSIDLS